MLANSVVFMLLNNIGISLNGATNRIGEKAFHLLPRLGSWVRIPSPAPDFITKIKDFEAALRAVFASKTPATAIWKLSGSTAQKVGGGGIAGTAVPEAPARQPSGVETDA